jgi:hypothetical protein
MDRLPSFVLGLGLLLSGRAQAVGSPCPRFFRDYFDQAGVAATGALSEAALKPLEALAAQRPDKCASGDYAVFAGRYADLVMVVVGRGPSDLGLRLLASARTLAPRLVPTPQYDVAFHAYLDQRARVQSHLPAGPQQTDGLALFDTVRPLEAPASHPLPPDRERLAAELSEARQLLALGQVAAADARLAETISALQVAPAAAPAAPPPAGPAPAPAPAPDGGK